VNEVVENQRGESEAQIGSGFVSSLLFSTSLLSSFREISHVCGHECVEMRTNSRFSG
jgi:hypothetical protein